MPVPVRPTRVAASVSLSVAVMTPEVSASIAFRIDTVVLSDTVRASVPESVTPALLIAVVIAEAVPVIKVAPVASTATVVEASMVFRFAAVTVVSATVAVYALPVPVRPIKVAASVSLSVAVITPEVRAPSVFSAVTDAVPETVKASVPESARPELPNAVASAAAVPVIVVADTVTVPVVAASMVFRFAAETVASATVAV